MDINTNPKIIISRTSQYVNKLRSYKVFIDSKVVGKIKDGERLTLEVAPGKHSIYLEIDWCKSNNIKFNSKQNEITQFNCGSNIKGVKILFTWCFLFSKNKWVYLQKR
ncbi:hypothetical protein [Bacillus sp. EAC]|uniref:hypothetical protein n=1 Tax=Bacillus sp. EAC TaxID=1978338 RepID=UPI000B4313AC|nr:hypothetical protein [Bacillus sp. EAC]